MNDPILDDLYAIRERMLSESGGTLEGLVARLQKEQLTSGHPIWEPKKIDKSTANHDDTHTHNDNVSSYR